MSEKTKIGKLADFPSNQTKGVDVEGKSFCVANVNGKISVFEDSCTHAQAALSGSAIENGEITCPLHGARFDVLSGSAKSLPATEPLKLLTVTIEGDDIFIS